MLPEDEDDEGWILQIQEVFNGTETMVDRVLDDAAEAELEEVRRRKEEEVTLDSRKNYDKQVGELLSHRAYEQLKFRSTAGALRDILENTHHEHLTHVIEAVKESLIRLKDRVDMCDQVQQKLVALLTDEDMKEEEATSIFTTFETYDKICNESHMFISKHGKEINTYHAKEMGNGSLGIRLEKLKFQTFNGELGKIP